MKTVVRIVATMIFLTGVGMSVKAVAQEVKEKAIDGLNDVKIKVRMEGPYTADVPLQVVCYFKYTPEGVKRMSGAPVETRQEAGRRHRLAARTRRIRWRRA